MVGPVVSRSVRKDLEELANHLEGVSRLWGALPSEAGTRRLLARLQQGAALLRERLAERPEPPAGIA